MTSRSKPKPLAGPFVPLGLAMLLAVGCNAPRHVPAGSPLPPAQKARYHATEDFTEMENASHTWRLKGNATNVVIRPLQNP